MGQAWCTHHIVLPNETRINLRIAGVSIVSLQDSETESETAEKGDTLLLGDAISLLGVAFYGCYTTLLKLRIQHESRVDMTLFFGFVGLYCLVFLWPFIMILSVLGVEPLELPPSTAATLCIIVNTPLVIFVDYLGKHGDNIYIRLSVDLGYVDDVSVDRDDGIEFEYTPGVTG